MRRPVAVELQDQLGEIRLDRLDATGSERVVQLDLVGRQRLHLHDLVDAVRARDSSDDRVRLGARRAPSARAPRRPAPQPRTGAGARRGGHDVRLDRAAGFAERPPSREPPRRRSRACSRIVVVALRRLCRSWRRRARRAPLPGKSVTTRGSPRGASCGRRPAARERAADLHQARAVDGRAHLGARVEDRPALVRHHRRRGLGVLDGERPAEAAALVASASSTSSSPRTARSSRSGASPTRVTRSE